MPGLCWRLEVHSSVRHYPCPQKLLREGERSVLSVIIGVGLQHCESVVKEVLISAT